jgi:hypothetical protein
MPDTYSEDTVRAVAEVRERQYDQEFDSSHLSWKDFAGEAKEILDVLAERGLLLPEGAEQRTEWAVWWLGPSSGIRLTKEHLTSREEAEQTVPIRIGQYGIDRWELRYREHRDFTDGSCWSGPWSPVPPEPKEPTDA